jgi:hypothetical protein
MTRPAAKIHNGSEWVEVTPDSVRVRVLDGSWVSLREAINRYDSGSRP